MREDERGTPREANEGLSAHGLESTGVESWAADAPSFRAAWRDLELEIMGYLREQGEAAARTAALQYAMVTRKLLRTKPGHGNAHLNANEHLLGIKLTITTHHPTD